MILRNSHNLFKNIFLNAKTVKVPYSNGEIEDYQAETANRQSQCPLFKCLNKKTAKLEFEFKDDKYTIDINDKTTFIINNKKETFEILNLFMFFDGLCIYLMDTTTSTFFKIEVNEVIIDSPFDLTPQQQRYTSTEKRLSSLYIDKNEIRSPNDSKPIPTNSIINIQFYDAEIMTSEDIEKVTKWITAYNKKKSSLDDMIPDQSLKNVINNNNTSVTKPFVNSSPFTTNNIITMQFPDNTILKCYKNSNGTLIIRDESLRENKTFLYLKRYVLVIDNKTGEMNIYLAQLYDNKGNKFAYKDFDDGWFTATKLDETGINKELKEFTGNKPNDNIITRITLIPANNLLKNQENINTLSGVLKSNENFITLQNSNSKQISNEEIREIVKSYKPQINTESPKITLPTSNLQSIPTPVKSVSINLPQTKIESLNITLPTSISQSIKPQVKSSNITLSPITIKSNNIQLSTLPITIDTSLSKTLQQTNNNAYENSQLKHIMDPFLNPTEPKNEQEFDFNIALMTSANQNNTITIEFSDKTTLKCYKNANGKLIMNNSTFLENKTMLYLKRYVLVIDNKTGEMNIYLAQLYNNKNNQFAYSHLGDGVNVLNWGFGNTTFIESKEEENFLKGDLPKDNTINKIELHQIKPNTKIQSGLTRNDISNDEKSNIEKLIYLIEKKNYSIIDTPTSLSHENILNILKKRQDDLNTTLQSVIIEPKQSTQTKQEIASKLVLQKPLLEHSSITLAKNDVKPVRLAKTSNISAKEIDDNTPDYEDITFKKDSNSSTDKNALKTSTPTQLEVIQPTLLLPKVEKPIVQASNNSRTLNFHDAKPPTEQIIAAIDSPLISPSHTELKKIEVPISALQTTTKQADNKEQLISVVKTAKQEDNKAPVSAKQTELPKVVSEPIVESALKDDQIKKLHVKIVKEPVIINATITKSAVETAKETTLPAAKSAIEPTKSVLLGDDNDSLSRIILQEVIKPTLSSKSLSQISNRSASISSEKQKLEPIIDKSSLLNKSLNAKINSEKIQLDTSISTAVSTTNDTSILSLKPLIQQDSLLNASTQETISQKLVPQTTHASITLAPKVVPAIKSSVGPALKDATLKNDQIIQSAVESAKPAVELTVLVEDRKSTTKQAIVAKQQPLNKKTNSSEKTANQLETNISTAVSEINNNSIINQLTISKMVDIILKPKEPDFSQTILMPNVQLGDKIEYPFNTSISPISLQSELEKANHMQSNHQTTITFLVLVVLLGGITLIEANKQTTSEILTMKASKSKMINSSVKATATDNIISTKAETPIDTSTA